MAPVPAWLSVIVAVFSGVAGNSVPWAAAVVRLMTNVVLAAKVRLLLEDGSVYPTPGELQFKDITVDPSTGSVTVRALFPNPDGVLLPGMFVRARIEEGVREGAILVPQAGVTHDPQGNATALVVGAEGQVEVRKLQVAGTQGDQWIVAGGLEDGERVIVGGLQRAQPGTTVQAAEAATNTATPSRNARSRG